MKCFLQVSFIYLFIYLLKLIFCDFKDDGCVNLKLRMGVCVCIMYNVHRYI